MKIENADKVQRLLDNLQKLKASLESLNETNNFGLDLIISTTYASGIGFTTTPIHRDISFIFTTEDMKNILADKIAEIKIQLEEL